MLLNMHSDAFKTVTAPTKCIRLLLDHFGRTPDIRAALCVNTDIDEKRLLEEDYQMTLYSLLTLADNLTRVIGQNWALDTINPKWAVPHGALGVAANTAPTVGESLNILFHFIHLHAPFLTTALRQDQTDTTLILNPNMVLSFPTLRALMETMLFRAATMLQLGLGDAFCALRYHFAWPAPPYAERLHTLSKSDITFEQPECALSLPNDLLKIRSPYDEPPLFAAAFEELQACSRRLKTQETVVMKLLDLFKRQKSGRISEDQAARQLGMSRRTLIRRLAESGTTYRMLLDAHLRQRAVVMLEEKLSRRHIAEQLGFSDPGSFSRAYRRWFNE